jgi:hypothetical protein
VEELPVCVSPNSHHQVVGLDAFGTTDEIKVITLSTQGLPFAFIDKSGPVTILTV